MNVAGRRLPAPLVTLTFAAVERRTTMTFTKQVAILAGGKAAWTSD
jgi:hypothetical protein